ncbi:MAG: DUF1501 domain-containing protein [Verrucomicrobiales bacterium]|nr:DUF1501 domain-containing protein [Verrucomicrobiales bacterium]
MISRRQLLQSSTLGFGYLAFSGLAAKAGPLSPKKPHHEPKAKRVIFLCMEGAPSHVDTFDYKPDLIRGGGKSFSGGSLLSPVAEFQQQGESGLWMSEHFPKLGQHADEMCIINGMHTDLPAHAQAFVKMHTGNSQFVRPSFGSWALYGLGTENENLPGFITLSPPGKNGGSQNYASSFLPAIYQATPIGNSGRLIENAEVSNLANTVKSGKAQRLQLDLLQKMNRSQLQRELVNPKIDGLIESYELAFRMQTEMPDVIDLSDESQATLDLYGIDGGVTDDFGRQCLLARKFAESGVRFIELTSPNWDHHTQLSTLLPEKCREIDTPIAGLIADLKQRDMLKDTLIIWGGEFGRTPYAQGADGRDHNNKAYSVWMAGGGVKGGMNYGVSDDVGYEAVQDPMDIHDLHATVLHLLGLDHESLTYRYAGRDFRLTDVYGNVPKAILA